MPSNMEELDAQDKVGFSANRYKDISFGVAQSQTPSMFGSSFMSDQSSQGIYLKRNSNKQGENQSNPLIILL